MADKLYVGTRKGLFTLVRKNGTWDIAETKFLGEPVSAVYADGVTTLAALDLGHFGPKLWRREGTGDWAEMQTPTFPEKPEDAADEPHPWTVGRIWNFTPAGKDGAFWAGTMPGGLFRSDDNGATWSLNTPLWTMPDRLKWMGVAGGEMPGLSTVLVDPGNPETLTLGVSCAGIWQTADGAKTWRNIGDGFDNEYMPPDQRHDPIAQDIHQLAHCRAHPNVIWCQHHSRIYRSTDQGHTWSPLENAKPSGFGFAVVAHPTDPETAWFVPATKDEQRFPVDARVVVSRTRDGGKTFEVLGNGLPDRHAYDLVYRHALDIDGTGDQLAFGSTSGGLWVSEDGGESWTAPDCRLPPIACVRFEL
ncbi:MAG: WD40/YVTN/BNR-like repeat-containing protein [Rhodospirillales bacterium]